MKPLNQHVLVKPIDTSETEVGGILVPSSDTGGVCKAHVVSFCDHIPSVFIKEGDVVYFSKYHGTSISVEGEDLKLLLYSQLMGIDA